MKDWVWNIFIMTASLTFVELVLPEGSIKKYLKFIFSLFVLAVIIYPFGDKLPGEISTALDLTQDGRIRSQKEENRILEQLLSTQTRQLQDIYLEKAEAAGRSFDKGQNPGISMPWPYIYSNDEEESN